MIRPRRDILIAAIIAAAGLAALAWFFLASPGLSRPEEAHMLALVLGALAAIIGLFLILNFGAAARIVGQLQRGRGVVGRWTIGPEALRQFQQRETARNQRNAWRPSRRETRLGTEAIFGAEAMVLGGRFLALPTAGLQSVRGIRLEAGPPPTLVVGAGTVATVGDRITRIDEDWRIPVTDPAAADAVVSHYGAALAGKVIVAPRRWIWRIRLGVAMMVLLPPLGLVGLWMAQGAQVRSAAEMILPLTLMILGVVGGIGGGVIALVARRFHRRQQGRG